MNVADEQLRQRPPDLSPDFDRRTVLERYRRHVNRGFTRLAELTALPIEVRSEGTRVYDEHGNAYLDCGGYAVFTHGHRHPAVIAAVKEQLELHPLSTRVLLNPQMAKAAETLAGVTPRGLDYVFFTNSGAEAAEVGIKLGRLNGRPRLIAMQGGYHGKTLGALSVTGRPKYQTPFAPLLPEVEFIPFGDAAALQAALAHDGDRACVILEPVQAEGGVIIPPDGYLRAVEALCRQSGAFLVLDEIQTGLGRLGAWWGRDREGITPDVMLVGKALSGGVVPVGAAVATAAAFEPLNRDPLLHSSTFAGNPLAAAAAHAALTVLQRDGLIDRARALGDRLLPAVTQLVNEGCPELVAGVRGRGLLIAIEFKTEHFAADFLFELMKRKVLVSHSLNSHQVMRLTPPAVLSEPDYEWLLGAVGEAAQALGERYAAPAA